jgi:hypothetical protein
VWRRGPREASGWKGVEVITGVDDIPAAEI